MSCRPTHRRARLAVVLGPATVLALLVGVTVLGPAAPAGASPRGVSATPANPGAHPWTTDGCSAVPDAGWWIHLGIPARFDFAHACVHHDGCYRAHWARRATCDGWFRADLLASCRVLHPRNPLTRATCEDLARLYHLGVRLLGAGAYRRGSEVIPLR